MRVALKFTFVVICLVMCILAIEVFLHVHDEQRLIEEETRAHHQVMGQNFQITLEYIWRNEGQRAARSFVLDKQLQISGARWRIIPFGHADQSHGLSHSQFARLKQGQSVLLERVHGQPSYTLASFWPIRLKGQIDWILEYRQSVKTIEMRLQDELRRLLIVNLWIFGLSTLIALIVGYFAVGRPMQQLLRRFDAVRRGDLHPQEVSHQRDEFGQIRASFEEMVAHLAMANQELSEAQRTQQEMMHQLRRSDRLRSVGTLAAGVAHELGTPLHVIQGRATMIRSEDARIQRHVQIIVEQSDRMQFIVRRLMDLSRDQVKNPVVVDLYPLCLKMTEVLEVLANKRSVTLSLIADDSTQYTVFADAILLEHALMNVVNNAIFASEPDQQVIIRLMHQTDAIAIQVEDHGCGMSAQVLEQALDPFFTTKEVGQGTGLGLSIVYGIINEHGGELDIQSCDDDSNHGTTVTLCLPEDTSKTL